MLCGEDLSGFVKMQDVFQICQFVQWDGVVRVLSMGIPEVLGDIVHFDGYSPTVRYLYYTVLYLDGQVMVREIRFVF